MGKQIVDDFIIRVDRSIQPPFKNGMVRMEYPEKSRPVEYDVRSLEKMPHQQQTKSYCSGNCDFEFLRDNNLLTECLDIFDLMAIQVKGYDFLRRHFAWEAVMGFGSPLRIGYKTQFEPSRNSIEVPYLEVNSDGEIIIDWCWLDVRESYPVTQGIWRHTRM